MRVFLSWSGSASKAIATALIDWLPLVVPPAKPWMSGHHIKAGTLWDQELANSLLSTNCALLLLTRDNQNAPWLLYEAGVLSRTPGEQRIIPYQIDLSLNNVAAPLARFQGVEATLDGTRKLVEELNSLLPDPLPINRLHTLFDVFWPKLQATIVAALASPSTAMRAHRETEDYLEEILSLLTDRGSTNSPSTTSTISAPNPDESLRAKVHSLNQIIASMEEYERNGGGASSEIWWDSYVDRHRRVRDLYVQALALVDQAGSVRLSQW